MESPWIVHGAAQFPGNARNRLSLSSLRHSPTPQPQGYPQIPGISSAWVRRAWGVLDTKRRKLRDPR